jgi:hypothetical protein
MLNKQEILIGALVATAFWAVVLVLTSDAASHYEICEVGKEGAKQAAKYCASYNIVSFALREVGMHLDIVSALITAVATAFIARYTFTLKRSTDNLWTSAKDQLGLAREEFISTHRPKITVYSLAFAGSMSDPKPIPISFRYVNSGDSDALVTGVGSQIFHLTPTIMLPGEIQFRDEKIEPPISVPSGMHGIKLTLATIRPAVILAAGARPDTEKIVCVGYVLYRDGNGTRRQAGFCREFNLATGRWTKMQDDEYEYSY